MPNTNLLYQVALTKIPKVGAVTARNLVSHCGGVKAVFSERAQALRRIPGVGNTLARNIRNAQVLREAELECKYIERHQIDTHFYLDASYPARLKHHNQSPILLYSKGELGLNPKHAIAIVGTRQPSDYGLMTCEQLINGLVPFCPTVVSGLAYGIDITAHRSAVQRSLPTIGVLGSGLGKVYPGAHLRVARQMMKNGGLLTEFGFQAKPDKENFPVRNRIVAGMVDAVVVIETKVAGGSVITVEFANAFNKDVMAVPGRIGDPLSEGCNQLIRQHKAHLVTGAHDLVQLLGWDHEPAPGTQVQMFQDLNGDEQIVFELVTNASGIDIDLLAQQSKLRLSELATVLLSLEFKGLVKALPGKRYRII